jgi:DNA-binding Lrp family transcriptional regulator
MPDEITMAILDEMARDGRVTFTELAKKTKMSVPGIRDRVLRMIKTGDIIVKALVNANKFGIKLAFVTIKTPNAQTAVQAVERIMVCPRTLMSTSTVGQFGAFAILAAPDLALLHHTLNNLLGIFGDKVQYEVAYCDR